MAATFYGRNKLIEEFDAELKSVEEDCLREVGMEEMEDALLEDDRGASDMDIENLFTLKQLSKKTN